MHSLGIVFKKFILVQPLFRDFVFMQKISDQIAFYPTHRSVPLATAKNSKYNETVLEYKKMLLFHTDKFCS